jgi:hypothetical protein
MTVTNIPDFASGLQKELEAKIREYTKEAVLKLRKDVDAEIDRVLAAIVIEVFSICSFEYAGRELRITVDTSKMKDGSLKASS